MEEVVCIFITGLEGLLRRSNIKTFLKPEVLSLIRGSYFRSYRSLPRRRFLGRDEKPAPLKTLAWEAIPTGAWNVEYGMHNFSAKTAGTVRKIVLFFFSFFKFVCLFPRLD